MEKVPDAVELVTLENSGHALDNAVVLRQIFKELGRSGSLADLKNARLVTYASNWQDELLRVWRREAVLVLWTGELFPISKAGTTLDTYLVELQDPDSPYRLAQVPYERVQLRYIKVRQEDLDLDSPFGNFWDAMGSSVKHLALENVTLDIPPTQDLMLFLKAKFPNLESLRLDNVDQDSLSELFEKELPLPGHEVTLDKVTKLELGSGSSRNLNFGNFPNLQEFKVFGESSLQELERGPMTIVPGVKQVDLLDSIHDDVFSSRLNFPELEYLSAKITEEQGDDFLKAHSGTLKTLELFRLLVYIPQNMNPIIQTEFSVLTTLRLWGNVMGDLSFLRFTPNLQKLHWDVDVYEKESEIRDEINYNEVYVNDLIILTIDDLMNNATQGLMEGVELSKLEYCHLSCGLTAENVQTLARWMPQLKTFNAVVDPNGFREVCKQWEKLEELSCLFGSHILDQDIAPPENQVQGMKGLTDLKGLKSFSFYPDCNWSVLSDACVKRGFLQMAQLSKLHISVSNQFSEASEQLLRERIPDLRIYRHNSEEKFDCCKIKEYKKFISGEDSEYEDDSDEEEEEIDEADEIEEEQTDSLESEESD